VIGLVDVGGTTNAAELLAEAEAFLCQYHHETGREDQLGGRLPQVRAEVAERGTYTHTFSELEFGARVAWRNSRRCIGRLYWRGLRVVDRRDARTAAQVFAGLVEHLRTATNRGRLRATITVFAAAERGWPGVRIRNEQLIRYAGYRLGGRVVGDPRNLELTECALALGWTGGTGGPHDVLPLILDVPGGQPRLFTLPDDAVLEVPIEHPEHAWFADLGVRWHAVPAIADQRLEIGGISYPAAPFNGWYMGTEVGARNLADHDRYNLLPTIADRLGLDRRADRTLWKDRALVELNIAVLASFEKAGVTITDHHTEARRFLHHLTVEQEAGRVVPADWSWIVPPMSASTTPVFHRYYDDVELRPNFFRPDQPRVSGCPAS
jgi:nitric-oxide synthase, bacterial